MNLTNLQKITIKKKKRLGQGHGSGRVKTAGRGTKGQNARGKMPLFFEGGALPLIKRLPFLRGRGENNPVRKRAIGVNVSELNNLPKNSVVDLKALIENKIVDSKKANLFGVKILGNGDLKVPLTVKLSVSTGALEKIKKIGGSVS